MRSRSWVGIVAAAAIVGVMSWGQFTQNDHVTSFVYWAVVGLFVVLVTWRVVRALARPGGSARRVLAPGMQGLDEVQGLYLGRKPVGPVVYGTEDGPVPELVVDRPDPLDDTVWRV